MKESYETANEFPEEQVHTAIQVGIARGEVEKKQNQKHTTVNKKRTFVYVVGSVVAIFVILLGFSSQSPTLASSLSKIPIIGSVFGDSDLIGLQQAQEKELTIQIGETKTINGISVILEEVLYDQNNITIGLKMESERELDDEYFGSGMDFTIDGKEPSGSSGSYGEEVLSSTSRTAIETITVSGEMPNEFDLGLLLQGDNGEKWYFSTPITQVKDIKKIPVQHTEIIDGIKLDVTEFSYGDSGASVSFKSSEDATLADDGLSRASNIEFTLEDQDGNKIKIIPINKIHYLEAADDYVKVHTKDGYFLKNKTMSHFEQVLDTQHFVRSHRSYIINIQQITRIDPYEKDNHVAILRSGAKVPVSRSGYGKLRQVLGL